MDCDEGWEILYESQHAQLRNKIKNKKSDRDVTSWRPSPTHIRSPGACLAPGSLASPVLLGACSSGSRIAQRE